MVAHQVYNPENQKMDLNFLKQTSRAFFKRYGSTKLLGQSFFAQISSSLDSEYSDLFDGMVRVCGYGDDTGAFLTDLINMVLKNKKQIRFNNIDIPELYLYELLSLIIPGEKCHAIKTVRQLEDKTGLNVHDPEKLQQVIDMYPVRLSDHVIRQSMVSEKVAAQYLPFEQELDSTGHVITFDGHFKNGLLEQMYQNRVVFLLDMHCPVYCRFCFRKHKSNRREKTPLKKDVLAAVDHVRSHISIKEILITGGEPLLNRLNLETAINGLVLIDHVQTIRIATRSIVYYPALFLRNDKEYIKYLIKKNRLCRKSGKTIELGIHIVHPDEVSIQTLEIISDLVKNGIQVYVQTPFLNKVNTKGEVLARLFALLYRAGAKIYYIFTPCSPIHGTKEYWAPISHAIEAANYLRKNVSDRCVPKLCTATPLGKIEWNTSGWAVEKDEQDPRFTWIRTPYTKDYFKQFLSVSRQIPEHRVNPEGTLDARFRLDMGENFIFKGNLRNTTKKAVEYDSNSDKPGSVSSPAGSEVRRFISSWLKNPVSPRLSIEKTSLPGVIRFHKCSVQVDIRSSKKVLSYLERQKEITDVVLCVDLNNFEEFNTAMDFINKLKTLEHIICARICLKSLALDPESLTPEAIKYIAACTDFAVESSFRIEVETWFFCPDQILESHGRVARAFINRGINIYASVPLIKGLNDHPVTMVALADKLRTASIEFHHFYVSGLDIQKQLNNTQADDSVIIDIASEIRAKCSGRQIPLYIVQTSEGEVDYKPEFNDSLCN